MNLHKHLIGLLLGFVINIGTYCSAVAQEAYTLAALAGQGGSTKNIVTVAKQYGNYTDPIKAIASITNASEENPYVVFVAPGVYPIEGQLVLKPYVDIIGSGIGISQILGSVSVDDNSPSALAALVVGAQNSNVSDIELVNEIESGIGVGLYSNDASQKLNSVRVVVSGGDSGIGVFSVEGANLSIAGSDISVTNKGFSAKGLEAFQATLNITNSEVSANTPGQFSTGIILNNVRPPFGASIQGTHISLLGSGSVRRGIFSSANTTRTIRVSDSHVEGTTISLSALTTAVFFASNTILEGAVEGTPKCSFVFLADGTPLDDNCEAP